MGKVAIRTYEPSQCVVFLKTQETFGGLSNMAGGYPIVVNGTRLLTSEALYQACRFPSSPDVQRLIISQTSPMTAKMKSKPFLAGTRNDWLRVRVRIMRWCLACKLVQNRDKFSSLLLKTERLSIVEQSRKDTFWGAVPDGQGNLIGANVLGRLLMELRESIYSEVEITEVKPLEIDNFFLFGEPIGTVNFREGSETYPMDSLF